MVSAASTSLTTVVKRLIVVEEKEIGCVRSSSNRVAKRSSISKLTIVILN